MKAVVKIAGKQYFVKEGDVITIEKNLDTSVGGKIEFKEVLAVGPARQDSAGGKEKLKFGSPLVKNAKVTGEIVQKEKNEKVVVFKFKKRKRYHRRRGHRQEITKIKITKIEQ